MRNRAHSEHERNKGEGERKNTHKRKQSSIITQHTAHNASAHTQTLCGVSVKKRKEGKEEREKERKSEIKKRMHKKSTHQSVPALPQSHRCSDQPKQRTWAFTKDV